MKFLRLYDHVRVEGDRKDWQVQNATVTVEDLTEMLKSEVIVYQNHHAVWEGCPQTEMRCNGGLGDGIA